MRRREGSSASSSALAADARDTYTMKNIKTYTALLNEAEDQEFLDRMLQHAALNGNTDDARSLLDRGAQIDVMPDGYAPIHYGLHSSHTGILDLLLDRGAQIDPVNHHGETPLKMAVTLDRPHHAKLLILRGADPFKAFKDPGEILWFFDGDIDWWPEGDLRTKLKRMQKGKSAFGI